MIHYGQRLSELVAANAADLEDFKRLGYKKGFNVADNERLPFRWSLGTYLSAFLWYGLTSPPHTRRDYLDIFFTAYAVALGGARSKKMVTAFTPRANFINSHPGNEEFFSDYPDGTMICICRHPADWYASASRHQKKYADVEVAMALWRESAESALVLHAKHPRQVLLLPFDDLVLSRGDMMRLVATRLGLIWNDCLLTPTFGGEPIPSNSSFHAVTGIDATAAERRNVLPASVREQISVENAALYEHFVATSNTSSLSQISLSP